MGRSGLASVAAAAIVLLAGCASPHPTKGHPPVKSSALRAEVLDPARELVHLTGMQLTHAVLDYGACDSQNDEFRGEIYAAYRTPKSDADTAALVDRWVRELSPAGWRTDTAAIAHNSTVLTKNGVTVDLTRLSHSTLALTNMQVRGATCVPLPYDLTVQNPEDVLSQLQ